MHQQIQILLAFATAYFRTLSSAEYAFLPNETQSVYTLDDIYNEDNNLSADRYFERCYGIYGCFPVDYPWKSEQRAHSVFPFSPSVLKVKFPIFTHKTRESPVVVNIDSISAISLLNINKNHKIYIITAGFMEIGNSLWMIKIMNEILDYDNKATVVIVDWHNGSSPPYYQAAANTRVVGAILAQMIMALALELELANLDKFHLIGHSLGSHLSGYAGYFVKRNFGLILGRITGLDPAKPYFEFTPPIVRLDTTDAKFVDIIHTDSATFQEKSLGLKQPIGHIDFYPNGGRDQPLCQEKDYDPNCNHKNAYELFTESINTKCPFTAISCKSYGDFREGNCAKCNEDGNSCIKFGFHSEDSYNQLIKDRKFSNSNFYFLTSPSVPFCINHYKITLKMADSIIHQGDVGTLEIRIITSDEKGSKKIKLTKNQMNFDAGKFYTFFIPINVIGEDIHIVRVLYSYKFSWMRVKTPQIFIDFMEIQSMENGSTLKFCSKNNQPLLNGLVSEFQKHFCKKL